MVKLKGKCCNVEIEIIGRSDNRNICSFEFIAEILTRFYTNIHQRLIEGKKTE